MSIIAVDRWVVGPLGLQGAVQPVNLAVLSREVESDGNCRAPWGGDNVGQYVVVDPCGVGHDALD